jgi:NNP family nitrate/nitrite transporter-like MFS transporter
MTTTTTTAPPVDLVGQSKGLRGGWIEHWEPEDNAFWEATGRTTAHRNLVASIFAEHLGFAIWVIWTIVVINLGNVGITMSVPELFWLTAVPNLIGSALRLPYTFAVPRFGGRLWTMISAALLLIPTLLLAVVVPSGWLARQGHDTQLWVLLFCAATAGVGGGNFSSSMFNISFFFPERKKGLALGLNAAGGNLGVAVAGRAVDGVDVVAAVARLELEPQPVAEGVAEAEQPDRARIVGRFRIGAVAAEIDVGLEVRPSGAADVEAAVLAVDDAGVLGQRLSRHAADEARDQTKGRALL